MGQKRPGGRNHAKQMGRKHTIILANVLIAELKISPTPDLQQKKQTEKVPCIRGDP